MAVLDLRAPKITIKFDKGNHLQPVFFYLNKDFSVIDITGYTARSQTRLTNTSPVLTDWDLTTQNGGLVLVVRDYLDDDGQIITANAHGVQFNILDTITAAITWESAVFDIELIDQGGVVLPFIKGDWQPDEEQTR
jgi:hypothetical protein